MEGCLDAQSPYHRQKEAQCRAAVLAGEGSGFWKSRNWADPVSGVHLLNVRTQRTQALCGGIHIPVGFRAENLCFPVSEGCQDQQSVGLGLGWDSPDGAI